MKSTVFPNYRQVIIAMLNGGMTGQFCEPSKVNPTKVVKPRLAPKGAGFVFLLSPYLGADGLIVSRIFDVLDPIRARGPQIRAIPGNSSLLRPSLMISWLHI